MFFQSRKKNLPSLIVSRGAERLYDGPLKDIPIRESVILEKSITFFDDPEPCHIHRSAVRVRLISELQEELARQKDNLPGELMRTYADFDDIDKCHISCTD